MSEEKPVKVDEQEKALEFLATRDISLLDPEQRGQYLLQLHRAMGISPFARAFDFISVKGPDGRARTILYANRTAADQLAQQHGIEAKVIYAGPLRIGQQERADIYTVEMEIRIPTVRDERGVPIYFRSIQSVGSVPIGYWQGDKLLFTMGDALSNAYMKAHTKAWRRGVLTIMGCGFPDEVEVETIPSAPTEPAPRVVTPAAPETTSNDRTDATVPVNFPRPLPAAKPPK